MVVDMSTLIDCSFENSVVEDLLFIFKFLKIGIGIGLFTSQNKYLASSFPA